MSRHSQNTNLHLHYDPSYQGFPVQTEPGPLIVEYLDVLYRTMQATLNAHPRVFAFRIDLRFSDGLRIEPYLNSNFVIELFIASSKEKIAHNRAAARRKYGQAHDTSVRYVWAREVGRSGKPHFHLVFFLSNDAFGSLGIFESGRDNMFNRLHEAWASALNLSVNSVMGLVEIPSNSCYYVRRNDPASMAELFYRASYLCKAATKSYGNGCHAFGSSRR